jgi:ubiquinone/menaquinone biosynthesis C-methylase UbiE
LSDQISYDPRSIRDLFDEMATTYGVLNLILSFGFAARWRSQAISVLPPTAPFRRVADLMSGMGELWHALGRHVAQELDITAVDLSSGMASRASRSERLAVTWHIDDVLACEFQPASFDAVVCSFGLKTLSNDQQEQLSRRVATWLRAGGVFSFMEISVPPFRPLRLLYMFYVRRIIPLLGRLLLGNPDNYRLLGIYTQAFGDCWQFARCLERAGLQVTFKRYFFGCASGVCGSKP